jgi:adenylate kinase
VLDGYPKTYVDVKGVFLRPDKPAEDGDENVPLVLDTTIAPQSVINFIASDEFLFERTSKLPESVIAGTHYTPQHMKRRLDNYRAINRTGTGIKLCSLTLGFPIMTNFF